jgi:hypothetical protein
MFVIAGVLILSMLTASAAAGSDAPGWLVFVFGLIIAAAVFIVGFNQKR